MAKQPVKPVGKCRALKPRWHVHVSCECGWDGSDHAADDGGLLGAYAELRAHWIQCGAEFDPAKVRPNGTLIKDR